MAFIAAAAEDLYKSFPGKVTPETALRIVARAYVMAKATKPVLETTP